MILPEQSLLLEKKVKLQDAITQLKKEFVGIDSIIDELANLILPWWLFAENQFRPLIVNLWGMTGSGKTALIKRLAELLAYDKKLLRFDMGEFDSNTSFLKYTLTRQFNQFSEQSPIIVLDEFQFAKTKDETGKEANNVSLRIIWDLLDSGVLMIEPNNHSYPLMRLKKLMQALMKAKKMDIVVKNAIIMNQIEEMYQLIQDIEYGEYDDEKIAKGSKKKIAKERVLLMERVTTIITDVNHEDYSSLNAVRTKMQELGDLTSIIDFIGDVLEAEFAFKKMDLTKSLVFVVGNLDEAFTMSDNINPDIDADEFRRFTMRITIADIKTALQTRFRNEQIARLGNNHLIYQAFSHKDFEALIQLHLNNIAKLVQEKFQLNFDFAPSVNKMLYSEGVFPTQGVRPILSTVRNLIESHVTKIILFIAEKQLTAVDRVSWDFIDDNFEVTFFEKNQKVDSMSFLVLQKINSLRKTTNDELQTMVAVHESGHVVASMLLAKVVPEYVVTKTVDSESNGFAYVIMPDEIYTRRLLLDQIRLRLGGYVAEKLVFGAENNTTGVSQDLMQVTRIAHQIVREFGMADKPFLLNIHSYGGNPHQFTFTDAHEKETQRIIEDCLKEVETCLAEHMPLLIEYSKYLSRNSRLDKEDLIRLATIYFEESGKTPVTFVDKNTYYNFKERLSQL